MFRSAVLKLTLWYVILAMSLSLAFSTALYLFSNREIKEGLNHQYNELTKLETDKVKSPNIIKGELKISSNHLLLDFFYLNSSVLILSSLAGYFLAKRTLKPIREAHTAQVRFSEEASHELKTPLTSLKIATELATLNPNQSPKEYLNILKDNLRDINTLENLINYLLLIARGEQDDASEELLASELVRTALENVQLIASSKQIKIDFKVSNTLFKASKFKMVQLLSILLDNAIKYSPKKNKIFLNVYRFKDNLVIKVRDQGVGIPKEEIEHIFERYYRSRSADAKNGFGLGLSMAKEIVNKHHGTITVKSQENSGTTFVIKLPIDKK